MTEFDPISGLNRTQESNSVEPDFQDMLIEDLILEDIAFGDIFEESIELEPDND